jgi:hypothetical protein
VVREFIFVCSRLLIPNGLSKSNIGRAVCALDCRLIWPVNHNLRTLSIFVIFTLLIHLQREARLYAFPTEKLLLFIKWLGTRLNYARWYISCENNQITATFLNL